MCKERLKSSPKTVHMLCISSLESHIFHILLNGMLLGQGVFFFFAAFIVPPLDYMAEWVGFIFG